MRIIQVLDSFFPDSLGGTENYVLSVSQELQNKGHEVFIVSSKLEETQKYFYQNLPVYRFAIPSKPTRKVLSGLYPSEGIEEFSKILQEINPDIVHFNTFNRAINIHFLVKAKIMGFKTVFTSHLSSLFCIKGSLIDSQGNHCNGILNDHKCYLCFNKKYNKIDTIFNVASLFSFFNTFPLPLQYYQYRNKRNEYNLLSKFCDKNIALSEWIEDLCLKNGVKNTVLVKQGINSLFCSSSKEKKISGNILTILFVGRIYPAKGLDTLLKCLDLLDKNQLKIIFACIPRNDDYSKMVEDKIKSLPNFEWHEALSPGEIISVMKRADALILPSKYEMSPLVVLEAFAQGLPVIGSNISPITDNVKHEFNGLIFQRDNVSSLLECLEKLIQHPELLLKYQSNIPRTRTFATVANELEKVYLSI